MGRKVEVGDLCESLDMVSEKVTSLHRYSAMELRMRLGNWIWKREERDENLYSDLPASLACLAGVFEGNVCCFQRVG